MQFIGYFTDLSITNPVAEDYSVKNVGENCALLFDSIDGKTNCLFSQSGVPTCECSWYRCCDFVVVHVFLQNSVL